MSKDVRKTIIGINQWDVYCENNLVFSFDKIGYTKIQGQYGKSELTFKQVCLDIDYLEKILNVEDISKVTLIGKGVTTTEKNSHVYDHCVEIKNAILIDYCIEDNASPVLTLRFGFGSIYEDSVSVKVTYEEIKKNTEER